MRWLFIIIIVYITLVCGEHDTPKQHNDKSIKIAPYTQAKNHTMVGYQLVPLSKSFFCHPPRTVEGAQMMKVKTAAIKASHLPELKDPIVITGIVLFLFIGSVFLFPAYYLFRVAATFTGFTTSIYFTCQIYGLFHPEIIHFTTFLLWIGIPVGIVSSIIFCYFYSVSIYMLTFISGWLIVVFWSTLALTTDDIFKHFFLRDVFSLSIGVIFVIATWFYENIMVCLCLPFLGAYFLGLGVDLIYQTGLVYILGTSICLYEPLPKYSYQSSLTIGIVACLWILGAGAYMMMLRGRRWGLNIQRIYTEEEKSDNASAH